MLTGKSGQIDSCDMFTSITSVFYDTSLPTISRLVSSAASPPPQPTILSAKLVRSILTYYFDDLLSTGWYQGDRPINDQDFSIHRRTGDYPTMDLVLYNTEHRPLLDRLTRFRDPTMRKVIREAFWTICGSHSAILLYRRNNLLAKPWAFPPRPYARFVTRMNIIIQVQDINEQGIGGREPPSPWLLCQPAVARSQGDLQFLQHLFSGDYGPYPILKHIGLDVRSEQKLWEWYLAEPGGVGVLEKIQARIHQLISLVGQNIFRLRRVEVQGLPWHINGYRYEVNQEPKRFKEQYPNIPVRADWLKNTKWIWKTVWAVPEEDEMGMLVFRGQQALTTIDVNISRHPTLASPYSVAGGQGC